MIYKLQVEASSGASVKVNDRVTKGQKIGMAPDFKTPVTSPVNGMVKDLSFDADSHTFILIIEETDTQE